MWARRVKTLAALRCVATRWSVEAAAEHNGPGLSLAAIPAHNRHPALPLPLRRVCVQHMACLYSTVSWDHHTPSLETAPSDSYEEEESRAEELPEFNINVLVNLLRQENGKDLCVIRIPKEMKYVDYFVIVGGTSSRHLKAMAQYTLKVYKYLKKDFESHVCIEGKDTDDWMCIDFGTIVVHFMLTEIRDSLELEKLWTLRSHDDQLLQMVPEVLPPDFTFGFQKSD